MRRRPAAYWKKLFGMIALVWLCEGALAQINQEYRYEREHKTSANGWTIIPLRERGLAMVREVERYQDNQKIHELVILDTLLQEKASLDFPVANRMRLVGYDYEGGDYVDLLFRNGENDAGDLLLIEFHIVLHEFIRHEIKQEFNFKLTHFSTVDRNAVLGGYVNREPAVLLFEKDAKQLKVVPGFFTSDTELLDLRVNRNKTFNTLAINRSSRAEKSMLLRTFDKTGTQLLEDIIPIDESKTVLSGLTSSLVRDELLIAGTYSIGNSRQAAGFFSVLADPFQEQPIHYYDFPQVRHFLDYVTSKRAEKIKAVSTRMREHGKDPDFRAYVSNVRLEERPEGFFLLAEVYNSTTSSTPYPYQSGYPYYSAYGGYYPMSPFSSQIGRAHV